MRTLYVIAGKKIEMKLNDILFSACAPEFCKESCPQFIPEVVQINVDKYPDYPYINKEFCVK